MKSNENTIIEIIKKYVKENIGEEATMTVSENLVISHIFDSFSLTKLILYIESEISMTIPEDAFYEASIVTIGDLVDFFRAQSKILNLS